MDKQRTDEGKWISLLTGRDPLPQWERWLFRRLPADPRCKLCNLPFRGIGGRTLRLMGLGPSRKNPKFCNVCELHLRKHGGGAEIDMSLLFADVRGSTTLAERMTAREFGELMNRFFHVANHILVDSDAFIDKLVGDEVVGVYPPFVKDHPGRAIQSARKLLIATGHADPAGPWVPVGVGIHTGRAYFGVVGTEDTFTDVTVLGDAVNITSRLASIAAVGEVLISDAAFSEAKLELGTHEHRHLELKGRTEPIGVHVLRVGLAERVA